MTNSNYIPVPLLVKEKGNMYEVTCAAIRRAYQITMTGDEELSKTNGKVVSLAIKQILTRQVQYRIED